MIFWFWEGAAHTPATHSEKLVLRVASKLRRCHTHAGAFSNPRTLNRCMEIGRKWNEVGAFWKSSDRRV